MVAVFGGSGGAAAVLSRLPELFGHRPERLAAKLSQIQTLLQLPSREEALRLAAWAPQLLTASPDSLRARLEMLASALGLSAAGARQLVTRQPSLLLLDIQEVRKKIGAVAVALRLPHSEAQGLALSAPMLLNLSAPTLAAKCAAVAALEEAPHPPDAMVAAFPSLLLLGAEKLAQRWAFLRAAAASSPRWRAELPRLAPASLGALLCSSDARLSRLRFLFSAGAAGDVPLFRAVTMQDAAFAARFKGAAAWAEGERAAREGGAAEGAAAGVGGGGGGGVSGGGGGSAEQQPEG